MIPAGQTFIDIVIAPLADLPAEADEVVTIAVQGGASASVIIAANDLLVTGTADAGEGSLRQAVANANAFGGPQTVLFADGTGGTADFLTSPQTILLTTGEIPVTGLVTVPAAETGMLVIDASFAGRHLTVAPPPSSPCATSPSPTAAPAVLHRQ